MNILLPLVRDARDRRVHEPRPCRRRRLSVRRDEALRLRSQLHPGNRGAADAGHAPSGRPLPAIFVESATPLRQFQDAMEGQWQFRPPLVSNAYSVSSNEIYLTDDSFVLQALQADARRLARPRARALRAGEVSEGGPDDGRMRDAGGRGPTVVPRGTRTAEARRRGRDDDRGAGLCRRARGRRHPDRAVRDLGMTPVTRRGTAPDRRPPR